MNLAKLIVNVRGTIEDIAYKSRLLTRPVSIDPLIHFKIYSAKPTQLNLEKETLLMALLNNIQNGDVVYDIGANIGLYSLAVSTFNIDSVVYAFEPNPETFAKLSANLTLNKTSDNIKPLQIAIGNTDSESDFMISSQHERSSFYPFGATFGNARVKKIVKVTVERIDSLIGHLLPPQHIKIDAEGSESIILEGAQETIRKYKPILYIEPHSTEQEKKILQFLKSVEYETKKNSECYVCKPLTISSQVIVLAK
ncbi:MAG: FkbM family methyltransferase [Nitrososphaerota archaeon]|jgi:FkbM family methyltransferase|uniref:FkbM family methyltransferase n=1 Tax=Candidatus Bathycorpusculum sp. TaxID=2994959 RepID=UPI00281F19C5|nr:FkbM family methyltransferase [Candidatus Termitimicrobium sp.]MCL2431955.1 FkbM family methyltransferase [Candidatus Termitimicrobium sp.]MDR0493878.1 FkbM family methyltransferase [Nitrososphaerota archaeon]